MGKVGEGGWEVESSSYGMNSHGKNRHSIRNIANATVVAIGGQRW